MALALPNHVTVLFSSAGRRVELMNCFRADAAELGVDIRVLAVDVNPAMSAACHAADKAVQVPLGTSPEFIPCLLELCAREHVHLLVPTIDTELEVLAQNREAFSKIGTRVAISSPEVVEVARDKNKTAKFLAGLGIPTPRTGTLMDLKKHPQDWRWPVLLKPRYGSASIGIHPLMKPEALEHLVLDDRDYIAQEQWAGREYTVNLFFDGQGRLRCVVPHQRYEIRSGEVSKGITERVPELMATADKMEASLKGAFGALCFQAMMTSENKVAVFELNARFGGGYPLAHRAGAPFSKWLLEEALGLPGTANNQWREKVTMLRYDAAIFVENASRPFKK